MATASSSVELAIPADQVWQLIGGFGSPPDWLPFIPKSELREGGRTRHLANPDGSTIVERVEWSAEFTAKGVSDQQASKISQDIYDNGLKALAKNFTK